MSLFSKDLIEQPIFLPAESIVDGITFMGEIRGCEVKNGMIVIEQISDNEKFMLDPTNGNIYLVKY